MSETEERQKLSFTPRKGGWREIKSNTAVYGFQDDRQFMRSLWTPKLRRAGLSPDAEGLLQAEALAEGFVASDAKRTSDEFCECVAEILVRRSRKLLRRLRGTHVDDDLLALHAPVLRLSSTPLATAIVLSEAVSIGLEKIDLNSEADVPDGELYLFLASLSYALEAAWYHEPLPVSTGLERMDELFAELTAMMLEFSFSKPQAQEKLRRSQLVMELKRRYRGPDDRYPVRIPYPAHEETERPLSERMDEHTVELYFKAAYGERS